MIILKLCICAWIQDLASKTTGCFSEKQRNQIAIERCQEVAVVKESVSVGEKTAAVENSAVLQKLRAAFRICKPEGTFLSPNMGANHGTSRFVVPVQDISLVHTPPSVSSASALPQLSYHHHYPTSPFQQVPGWRGVHSSTNSIAFPRGKINTTLFNLSDIDHDTRGAFAATATKQHVSISIDSITRWRVNEFVKIIS